MSKKKIGLIIISLLMIIGMATWAISGIVTKGTLGKEDLRHWYDAGETTAKTYTRETSTGYSMTLHKFDWIGIDVLQVYGAGLSSLATKATLSTALADVGAVNKRAFWLSPGTWAIDAAFDTSAYTNITFIIPAGCKLQITAATTLANPIVIQPGGILDIDEDTTLSGSVIAGPNAFEIATGKTLTINGPFDAGLYQVFTWTGTGKMVFGAGAVDVKYTEWWGAKADGNAGTGTGTDSSAAFQAAVDSREGIVQLLTGTYKTNFIIKSNISISGQGPVATKLFPATDDAVIKTLLNVSTVRIKLSNFSVSGSFNKAVFTSSDGIRLKTTTASTFVDNICIENVRIDDMGRYGLYLYGETASGPFVQNLRLERVKLNHNTKAGLFVEGMLFEALATNCFITRNGDASNPNMLFSLVGGAGRVQRFRFESSNFNHADYETTGTAVSMAHAKQVSFDNCNFEEADIFINVSGALSTMLDINNSNFGSTHNVTSGIYLQDINGAKIKNSTFTCSGGATMTTGIYSDKATSRLKNIEIGKNTYESVTTPVNYNNNLTISTGAIHAYQDYMRIDTEGAAATDDLDDIYDSSGDSVESQLQDGDEITIKVVDSARNVVVKHLTGNIVLNGSRDFTLRGGSHLNLKWNKQGTNWRELGRSDAYGQGTRVVNLSTSQVNNLRATPIALVPAQGAGTIIEFVSAVLSYNYTGAAFTVGADEDFVIQYDGSTDVTASIETAGFIDQANDEMRWILPTWTITTDLVGLINKKLEIFNTGTGETADGGTSTIIINITYRIHATGL